MRYAVLTFVLFLTPALSFAREVSIGLASNFSEVSTGSSNPYGGYFKDGVSLALKDSESRLKKAGLSVRLSLFDYGATDARVLEATRSALASNVLAVLGYNYSSNALLAAPLHQAGKLPMLTPSASANRLGTMGRYVHMASFNNAFMGESLARVATERLKVRRAVLLPAANCAYCADLSDSFESAFRKDGGEIAAKLPLLSEDRDFSGLVQKLKGLSFDMILVPNQELTSARIIAAVRKAGINKPFLGADGWGNVGQEFFGILGGVDFTGFSVSHWHEGLKSEGSKSFVRRYKDTYGKAPNDTSVLAYDSMLLLVEAMIRAKEPTREGLENSLASIRNFQGITGKFEMSPNQAPKKSLVLLKANGKKFEVVESVDPSPRKAGVR
jgi:branched-chain amino acid transport system substrate-binding protein